MNKNNISDGSNDKNAYPNQKIEKSSKFSFIKYPAGTFGFENLTDDYRLLASFNHVWTCVKDNSMQSFILILR